MNPTTAEIRLLDQRIPLKTTDEDSALAAEVIDLVSARLAAAEGRITGNKVPHQIVLLALLDLAEEYLRAKRRVADFQEKIGAGADGLLGLLDTPGEAPSA